MSALKEKAKKLGLKGIVAHWDEYQDKEWLKPLLQAEEDTRAALAFERKIRSAHIGQFKPMSEFDWKWPTRIDREQVEDLFHLEFFKDNANVVLIGTNGLGKTMIAQNLAHAALMKGITTRFVKGSEMLHELHECDGSFARRRCLKKYSNYPLLVIDEVGYMHYGVAFADLLYEVISGRYDRHSTIVTTNKSFSQWNEVFPHAACAVTLVDRLLHKAESVLIEGESYRAKEASERSAEKAKARQQKRKRKDS